MAPLEIGKSSSIGTSFPNTYVFAAALALCLSFLCHRTTRTATWSNQYYVSIRRTHRLCARLTVIVLSKSWLVSPAYLFFNMESSPWEHGRHKRHGLYVDHTFLGHQIASSCFASLSLQLCYRTLVLGSHATIVTGRCCAMALSHPFHRFFVAFVWSPRSANNVAEMLTALVSEVAGTTLFAYVIGALVTIVLNLDPQTRLRKQKVGLIRVCHVQNVVGSCACSKRGVLVSRQFALVEEGTGVVSTIVLEN